MDLNIREYFLQREEGWVFGESFLQMLAPPEEFAPLDLYRAWDVALAQLSESDRQLQVEVFRSALSAYQHALSRNGSLHGDGLDPWFKAMAQIALGQLDKTQVRLGEGELLQGFAEIRKSMDAVDVIEEALGNAATQLYNRVVDQDQRNREAASKSGQRLPCHPRHAALYVVVQSLLAFDPACSGAFRDYVDAVRDVESGKKLSWKKDDEIVEQPCFAYIMRQQSGRPSGPIQSELTLTPFERLRVLLAGTPRAANAKSVVLASIVVVAGLALLVFLVLLGIRRSDINQFDADWIDPVYEALTEEGGREG